ncbi:prealbumin-like fold domain-containing protein, partial [Anaerovoracaceae bacterium 41-7]
MIVTDNKDENRGFKVTFPDTTTLQPVNCTDDDEAAGKLVFKSIEGTMVYPLGSPVATITTDENGIATTPNLPLGKYYIQEVKSGNGHVNSSQWREFELKYADQYTPLIWDEATLDNAAVSVKIDLSKLFETAYKSKEYQPGGGAVFGIFSAEEITAKTKTEKKIDTKKIGS